MHTATMAMSTTFSTMRGARFLLHWPSLMTTTLTRAVSCVQKLRLREAVQKARDMSFISHEYGTYSSHLFVGYDKFVDTLKQSQR